MSRGKKEPPRYGDRPWSLSEEGLKRQQEKGEARPPEIDIRAALALQARQLEELMDDKYLGLQEDINAVRRELRSHDRRWHGSVFYAIVMHVRWWWKKRSDKWGSDE